MQIYWAYCSRSAIVNVPQQSEISTTLTVSRSRCHLTNADLALWWVSSPGRAFWRQYASNLRAIFSCGELFIMGVCHPSLSSRSVCAERFVKASVSVSQFAEWFLRLIQNQKSYFYLHSQKNVYLFEKEVSHFTVFLSSWIKIRFKFRYFWRKQSTLIFQPQYPSKIRFDIKFDFRKYERVSKYFNPAS